MMSQNLSKSSHNKRAAAINELRQLIANGQVELAFSLGQTLLTKHKKDAEVHFLLGLVAEQTGQMKISRSYATKSIGYAEHPDAYFLLSRIEREEGNTNRSIELCDRAIHMRPDSIQLYIQRAGTLEEAGRIREAREVVEPLIEQLESSNQKIPTELKFELAKILVQEEQYTNAVELIDELMTNQTSPSQMLRLQLYLQAKAYDRSNEYVSAFTAASRANEIGQLDFDPVLYEQQVTTLIEQWTAERIAKFPTTSCEDELPVFIAGMPRSGTSLIDQIVDAHPNASGVGELSTLEIFAHQLSDAYNSELEPPKCFGHYDRFRWNRVARSYIKSVREQSPSGTLRVVNKALGNNKLVGLIACLFPNTRVIHALRDPRDVAISCYMGGFNDRRHPWTTRLDWITSSWDQSLRMMEHWKDVLDIPILDVCYEDLVTEPEIYVPQLIEFLGLTWDPACLEFHQSNRTVRTLSYDQVNRPIYTSSVSRHKKYMQYIDGVKFSDYPTQLK
ncbi:MAG: sulfotransferase [Phycisphaerales bacterium]|nr:sulfotransferase [Phycisphaerales bacterium]